VFTDWLDLCPHTITVEPFASVDLYGSYSYGAPATYRARVQGKNRMVRTVSGEEVVSTVTVYLQETVGPKDRITLPAIFAPTQPKILDVARVSDESGSHHTVVYC
jgi:hypothetical protein